MSLVGVGNLRCGPPVVASLAAWGPEMEVEVRLFDSNEERLDLMDRFARVCLDRTNAGHALKATSDPAEALEDADSVVLTVSEDCARRMKGAVEPTPVEAVPPGQSYLDLVRGDPNRPTPLERLSPQTRLILANPLRDDGRTREEALSEALESLLALAPPRARLLSLVRRVPLPPGREHDYLNWPSPLDTEQTLRVPHQILRWILGEATLDALLDEARRSPVLAWLESGP